jgi:hypothetical protein
MRTPFSYYTLSLFVAAIFHVLKEVRKQTPSLVHSNFASDLEEYGSEEDDTINGLTFPEMKTVPQLVLDGMISPLITDSA